MRSAAQLAWNHVDAMFHFFCLKGFRISLDAASHGMKLPGKLAGTSGKDAPKLWANGQWQRVVDYVTRDVHALIQLVTACETNRCVRWVTRSGTINEVCLPTGFLSVAQAFALPLPDTSWMDSPTPRAEFIQWLRSTRVRGRCGDHHDLTTPITGMRVVLTCKVN